MCQVVVHGDRMNNRRPLVVAHRGASMDHPENTLVAFEEARAQGADWVELDGRLSADGVLVVHHDAHLTDGRLIRQVDASDLPGEVPSLAEAFEACGTMGVNIEIKNLPGDPDHGDVHLVCEAVVGLAGAYRPFDQLLVSSFEMESVDRIRASEQRLPTGWLVMERSGQVLERTVAHGHGAVNPWDDLIDEALVAAAHKLGLRVNAWTVDNADRIAELATWGVDAIITNLPGTARQVVDEVVPA